MMHKALTILAFCSTIIFSAFSAKAIASEEAPSKAVTVQAVVKNYTSLVHANYQDAYQDAVQLQQAVGHLLAKPNDVTLAAAKKAWLQARDSYGQTEAFRFYEGPIDFVDETTHKAGPEGRLNAWPLNEAYIDYVQGDSDAGIVQDKNVTITKKMLSQKNQEYDEADVATGYHAVEFLLWGQDLSLDSAGKRPVSDYADISENSRRRAYLKVVTDQLVDDLKFLADSWKAKEGSYAETFRHDPLAIEKMLTGIATLSGFELASERMATALD